MIKALAKLKVFCVSEFHSEALLHEGANTERRWKKWLENFKCCLTFEEVQNQEGATFRKRVALLAIGGQTLRELFNTLPSHQQMRHTKHSQQH